MALNYFVTRLDDHQLEKLVEQCLQDIHSADQETRQRAALLCGVVRNERLQEPLMAMLQHPDPGYRISAVIALGKLGFATALQPLYQLFWATQSRQGPQAMNLQAAILEAMGDIDSPQAVPLLMQVFDAMADDPNERFAEIILGSLGHLTQQGHQTALTQLLWFLDDQRAAIRELAINELTRVFIPFPHLIPEALLTKFTALTQDISPLVQAAAQAALTELQQNSAYQPAATGFQEDVSSASDRTVAELILARMPLMRDMQIREEQGCLFLYQGKEVVARFKPLGINEETDESLWILGHLRNTGQWEDLPEVMGSLENCIQAIADDPYGLFGWLWNEEDPWL